MAVKTLGHGLSFSHSKEHNAFTLTLFYCSLSLSQGQPDSGRRLWRMLLRQPCCIWSRRAKSLFQSHLPSELKLHMSTCQCNVYTTEFTSQYKWTGWLYWTGDMPLSPGIAGCTQSTFSLYNPYRFVQIDLTICCIVYWKWKLTRDGKYILLFRVL